MAENHLRNDTRTEKDKANESLLRTIISKITERDFRLSFYGRHKIGGFIPRHYITRSNRGRKMDAKDVLRNRANVLAEINKAFDELEARVNG